MDGRSVRISRTHIDWIECVHKYLNHISYTFCSCHSTERTGNAKCQHASACQQPANEKEKEWMKPEFLIGLIKYSIAFSPPATDIFSWKIRFYWSKTTRQTRYIQPINVMDVTQLWRKFSFVDGIVHRRETQKLPLINRKCNFRSIGLVFITCMESRWSLVSLFYLCAQSVTTGLDTWPISVSGSNWMNSIEFRLMWFHVASMRWYSICGTYRDKKQNSK